MSKIDRKVELALDHALKLVRKSDYTRALSAIPPGICAESSRAFRELFIRLCGSNSVQNIKQVLRLGATCRIDFGGYGPLHAAILAGSGVKVLNFLIENGADIEHLGRDDQTPLLYATFQLSRDNALERRSAMQKILKMLLRKGAHANVVDAFGMSPIDYVAQCYNQVALRDLLKFGAQLSQANQAGAYAVGFVARMSTMLLRDVLNNSHFDKSDLNQALVTAVAWGKLENAKLLVQSGANLANEDRLSGRSFLEIARESKVPSMIKWVEKTLARIPRNS